MGRAFVTNPFEELVLTEADALQLKQLSRLLVLENVATYEALLRGGKLLDERCWKHHSRVEDLHAYGERTPSVLPMVATVGSLVGSLDDVMLGLLNTTPDAMRLKTSYIDDAHGAAILARLAGPSAERPFESVHVKWMEMDMPLSAASVVLNRDWVYLEATGVSMLANGERVGYNLLHSVDFPVTPPLPNRVRGHFAMCLMFRQSSPNSVENYSVGTFEAGGELPRFMQVALGAKALLSASQYAYFGQMKKLSWALEQEHLVNGGKRPAGVGVKGSPCDACGKKPGPLRLSRASCRLCERTLCSACKVSKRMSFITPDGQLTRRKVPFCALCISTVTRSSATEAASRHIETTSGILHARSSSSILQARSSSGMSSEMLSSGRHTDRTGSDSPA